ncbi:hypothetical protein BH24ACI3_BH24ACI3_14980 [soil metagenome]
MNCPVCKRELAPTLSICLTCGAMMNDTVREELAGKIGRTSGELRKPAEAELMESALPTKAKCEATIASSPQMTIVPQKKTLTADLPVKTTSQTLVDFQAKNQTVPDWRLQVQNSVRKRSGGSVSELSVAVSERSIPQTQMPTNGANALKVEIAEPPVETKGNPTVANALKRIEASRKAFLPADAASQNGSAAKNAQGVKTYPFNVVAPKPQAAMPPVAQSAASAVKPKLVSSLRIEKRAYDTNKLPPLPKPAELSSSFVSGELFEEELPHERLKATALAETGFAAEAAQPDVKAEEVIDDLAPLSMRFASGLFDLIIAGFATLIILSPIMVGGGTWLSISGVLDFVATLALFLFLYTTASLGFWGKTFGMRIFSLELIDVEGNNYPTIHQAAVNSAVYLLSMALGGLGFLTVLVNEEKRAFHDIVSGTLMIRDV